MTAAMPKFSTLGLELSDGGVVEWPEQGNGTIRRRDRHGDVMEVRERYTPGYQEWARLFRSARNARCRLDNLSGSDRLEA